MTKSTPHPSAHNAAESGKPLSAANQLESVPFCPLSQDEFAPDKVRAEQISSILSLASETLAALAPEGLDANSAQRICDLLLPSTDAIAVAITSTEAIMGYAGTDKDLNPLGGPIRTVATHQVLDDGLMRVVRSSKEIGFPVERFVINAAIIVPLSQGGFPIGTLKFYYPGEHSITETQLSIAGGFAELLSAQLDAAALEGQRKAATNLELRMLRSQINPHFLFNTLNTITSFVRTDPEMARTLLREFATFYRRTLEDTSDLIPLSRELEQTRRYLGLEIARFGTDRLQFEACVPDDLNECLVPAFVLQPLVENAVRHGMPSEGTLHIMVGAQSIGSDLIVRVEDDGVGMPEAFLEQEDENLAVPYGEIPDDMGSVGLGVAMRNIKERITGYYGSHSYMHVSSRKGRGTTVELYLFDGLNK